MTNHNQLHQQKGVIYFSASLFNARENLFNACLAKKLENTGYATYFPQRDGFELGLLGDEIKKQVNPKDANVAAINIVYVFDLGNLITKCDAVVANLDDPIDEGVAVELSYSKMMKMPIVGFRTDVRSPFGAPADVVSINVFPVYQCTSFIKLPVPRGNYDDVTKSIDNSLDKVLSQLEKDITKTKKAIPEDPVFSNIKKAYELLFNNIKDVHTPEAIKEIVSRYVANKSYFASIMTTLYDFSA